MCAELYSRSSRGMPDLLSFSPEFGISNSLFGFQMKSQVFSLALFHFEYVFSWKGLFWYICLPVWQSRGSGRKILVATEIHTDVPFGAPSQLIYYWILHGALHKGILPCFVALPP